MKNNNINNRIVTLLLSFILVVFSNTLINAQNKKQKARISVNFNKQGKQKTLKITGKFKENKKYKPTDGLDLSVYQVLENDSLVLLGDLKLSKKGTAELDVSKVFENILPEYSFEVNHKSSQKFKKASKNISIKVANLATAIKKVDDHYFIEAKLVDAENNPVEEAELKVQLQREFAPLAVGKGIYFTDENGMINVPITEIMPGINGKLNYEVVLDDSDDFGTIKSVLETDIGKPIVDLSTFDQRTMWSPPTKAPWAVLIIPNLLIFGIWSTIFILIFNLYRISNHKNYKS